MSFVMKRNLKDVYVDVISDDFIKSVFIQSEILKKDLKNQKFSIEKTYDKTYLRHYESIIELLEKFCGSKDIVIEIEMSVLPFEDRFYVCYLSKVKNFQDFPIFPFLQTTYALLIAEFKSSVCHSEVHTNIIHTEIYNHNIQQDDMIKIVEEYKNKYASDNYNNIIPMSGTQTELLNKVKLLKKTFAKEVAYDITKDFLMNFLNMLINDRIRYSYMKKICRFYINTSVEFSIRSI
jgi:hypothetical protein